MDERGSGLAEANGVQSILVEAQMVPELVENRDSDLLDQVALVREAALEWALVDHDPVGCDHPVAAGPLSQRDALVDTEQLLGPTLLRLRLDRHDHVV